MDKVGQRILSYMMERLGFSQVEATLLRQDYLHRYGTTMRGLMLHNGLDPEDYLAYVHDLPLEDYLTPNPALDAALAAIPAEKVVFTNATAEHAKRVLDLLGVTHHFSRVVDIRDMDYCSKPAPDAYKRLLAMLQAQPQECVLVEDRTRNLQPAKALGMITVLVDGENDGSADFVIETVTEIGEILKRLMGSSIQGALHGTPLR